MKKSLILSSIVICIILFVGFNILSTADKHVVTIVNNHELKGANEDLKVANQRLNQENKSLKQENEKLVALADSLVLEVNNELPKAIQSIKQDVKDGYNWATPEFAYIELAIKLDRQPTSLEYKQALTELQQTNMLYHPGHPDPSAKGKRVEAKELEALSKQIYK